MKESDSGIIADSGNYNDPGSDANSSGEGMMVTLPGGAGGHHRTVTMVNSGQTIAARAGDPLSRAAQIDKSNTGDDSFDLDEDGDDFEEENEYGPHHMATRYQDMMGDLMFMDMTYFDDEEMPDDENSDITLDNIVLDRIGSAPNHTISVVKLAKEIGKAEEEIRSFLRTFGEKVKVSSDLCSLTDTGKALVKEKLDARRFLDREWSPHHLAGDGAASYTQEVLQTPPRKGPPLSPRELIATDPIFGMQSPGWSSTEASPSKVTAGGGKGRGQVILEILAKSCETAPVGKGRVVSGMHDVRDLEAQPVSLPPPSSCPSTPPYSSPSKATATSTTTTPSTPVQEGDQTGSFLNVQNFAWKPLIPTKSNPPASTTENFNFTSLPQGMTTSQTGQGVSMPVRQNMLSIRPELRRFTQEGLTVVAAPLIRCVTLLLPALLGSSELYTFFIIIITCTSGKACNLLIVCTSGKIAHTSSEVYNLITNTSGKVCSLFIICISGKVCFLFIVYISGQLCNLLLITCASGKVCNLFIICIFFKVCFHCYCLHFL